MQLPRPIPITRDLVLLGGGHTHALVMRKWAMNPLAGVQVTLVNPGVKAPYTGMLPGYIAGHYQRRDLDIDLVKLARRAGARLVIDRAIGIDTVNKRVSLTSRPDIAYDTLSIDIGVTSNLSLQSTSDQGIVPAKPLGPFASAWSALLDRFNGQTSGPSIAIIGAGVAGAELALAMAHRLEALGMTNASISLIEAGSVPLRELNRSARRTVLSDLHAARVNIITEASAEAISETKDFVISTAGAQPYAWLAETGLKLENGFVVVDKSLQSVSAPNVFAAGDCAHLAAAPRPKAGVFAVRQAPILFKNLRAQLSGNALRPYRPQNSYLKLISRGRKSAVTDKWGIGISGNWVWQWKDRIDRAFMDQFRTLVDMPAPKRPRDLAIGVTEELDQNEHPCGACGAKVAQAPLLDGLISVRGETNATSAQSNDDAAIIETSGRTEVLSTDHLRAFNADAYTLAKVAAIHALGDIWAMGAQPQTVLSHIILPPMSSQKQSEMIREITTGASEVFSACDARIVGGHTSSGLELTIGFTVSGDLKQPPVTLSGASPGNVLVLTKPIGSGTVLAGEMRKLVDGDDYQIALANMCRTQAVASDLLAPVATSMTDITGFGLAGHLLNILDASHVSARLDLGKLPILPGAEQLTAIGVRSSLWRDNAQQSRRVSNLGGNRSDLLFDPQTCGGLLAAIPADRLDEVLSAFKDADEPIWQIGEITAGKPHINIISQCETKP